jgi:hypothetical protein
MYFPNATSSSIPQVQNATSFIDSEPGCGLYQVTSKGGSNSPITPKSYVTMLPTPSDLLETMF